MNSFSAEQAFDYQLPTERIAQRPIYPADQARLLLVKKYGSVLAGSTFHQLPDLLQAGDLLVFNDSRVIPARLLGEFTLDGGKVEVLLLRQEQGDIWLCLGKPLRKFRSGVSISFGDNLSATVIERVNNNQARLRFSPVRLSFDQCLEEIAFMPIPPYIRGGKADSQDRLDYQSIFGQKAGSVAAPTASLHFTPELISSLKAKKVAFEFVTLHIGAASFLPLWNQDQKKVIMPVSPGGELFVYLESVIRRLIEQRKAGGRVIAVGTTVVRALESIFNLFRQEGDERPQEGDLFETDLFIQPGYQFQLIDGLITNFHQPRTTHLLLLQALLGRTALEQAYQYALDNDFRFLSYGDGMMVL